MILKLAIIGSRNAPAINIAQYIEHRPGIVISGGAKGVDTLAREYAQNNGIEFLEFLPNYAKYGRCAPLKRNDEIAAAADVCLAFWDGKSRGTAYTVKKFKELGKPVHIIYINR